jgi:O-antigen ligase
MPQSENQAARFLDNAIIGVLFLFAVSAPLSIAATQTAWLLGILLSLVRILFRPRRELFRTPVDYALLGFFILTGLSSFLSYEPIVSIGKLRAASLFTIIYLFAQNIPSLRMARMLVIALIAGCAVSVIYTAGERVIGRGVKVQGVTENSPLYKAGIRDGDTLLKVDGEKLNEPEDIVSALSKPDKKPAAILTYRHELQPIYKVARGTLLTGNNALAQLGIAGWTHGRDWRATGFYGQFVTYAEMLQLVIAIALGLLVSLPNRRSRMGVVLLVVLAAFSAALVLTVTRASWAGMAVSAALLFGVSLRRRVLLIVGLLAIPLVIAGLVVLQQKRNVGFIDQSDQSTTWRETVWREGVNLLVSKPRHLLVGVGMDSIKGHWREWGMFEGGKIPWGHMHSNLLQIALERGLPALLSWLAFLFIYARTLWRSLRMTTDWMDKGIVLGALGGLAGFFTSGLVHYNWGDSEVVMVFYMIVGVALSIHRLLLSRRPVTRRT